MKPTSLLGLTLELIAEVERPGRLPSDARVGAFFRNRRFLGSHDRRWISEAVWAWLRHGDRARARWAAWAAEAGLSPAVAPHPGCRPGWGRVAELVALARDGLLPWDAQQTAEAARSLQGEAGGSTGPEGGRVGASDEAKGAPPRLLDRILGDPSGARERLSDDAWPVDPLERLAAEVSLPPWIAGSLVSELGAEDGRRLALSMARAAPLDIRVAVGRVDRESARRRLAEETGAGVEPTPWSPLGLRLDRRVDLRPTEPWRRGWIEVEDEGSQLVALSLDAAPGGTAIDACAGAGGKSLAIADLLLARGDGAPARLIASDPAPERLEELRTRAARAGAASAIEVVRVDPVGDLPATIPSADLVFLDVPCSGIGTLRRNPELRSRRLPAEIDEFRRLQLSILERWCPRVKPGGRLAYATCSILRAENEDVADAFRGRHPEFVPAASAWARANLPAPCAEGGFVRLDPVRTGTDGYFLAMWRRE